MNVKYPTMSFCEGSIRSFDSRLFSLVTPLFLNVRAIQERFSTFRLTRTKINSVFHVLRNISQRMLQLSLIDSSFH